MHAGAALLAILLGGAPALADNAGNTARSALSDCLKSLPANKLNDEKAIGECLDRAQRAAEQQDKRRGDIEFQRQLDQMDRMIERTTRGSRRP